MRRLAGHLILACLIAATCHAQTDSRTPIAVLDLTGQDISASQRQTFSDRLRHELFATGYFRVMERERMLDILKEQGFHVSGCISTECAVEVGQLIGVEKIVGGSVSKVGSIYTVNIRLINVETGEIERTAVQDCRCSIEDVLTRTLAQAAAGLAGTVPPPAQESQPDSGAIRAEAESYCQKADSLYWVGAYQEALVASERAIALDPDFKEAWNIKGLALGGLGRVQEALVAYDRALALDPKFREAWYNKGVALGNLRRYQQALSCFEAAQRLGDPDAQRTIEEIRGLMEGR